jgi:hypothetical protein
MSSIAITIKKFDPQQGTYASYGIIEVDEEFRDAIVSHFENNITSQGFYLYSIPQDNGTPYHGYTVNPDLKHYLEQRMRQKASL